MPVTILLQPMSIAPRDTPIIVMSGAEQVMLVQWDAIAEKWRYGAMPGETWDADYPKGWCKMLNAESVTIW